MLDRAWEDFLRFMAECLWWDGAITGPAGL